MHATHFARLSAILLAAASAPSTTHAEEIQVPEITIVEGKTPLDFRKSLARQYKSVALGCSESKNQHLLPGSLDGKDVKFLLDSGASRTFLSADSMKKLGFDLKVVGTQRGISGDDQLFSVKIDSFSLGGMMAIRGSEFPSIPMPLTPELDGLIGEDILGGGKAILDHVNHRLYILGSAADPLVKKRAEECGYHVLPLALDGKARTLELTLKGKTCRFIVDTGAESTIVDETYAQSLGLTIHQTDMKSGGVGNNHHTLGLISVDELGVGDLVYRRFPMMVMPLQHIQKPGENAYAGILGADFLWSSGAIMDWGNSQIYLPEDPVADIRDFTSSAGEMYANDDQLKQVWSESKSVSLVELKSFDVSDKTKVKDKNGKDWVGVILKVTVKENWKGELAAIGKEQEIGVLLPESDDMSAVVHRFFRATNMRIYFQRPDVQDKAVVRKYSAVIWADGTLPRTQLHRTGLLPLNTEPKP